MSEESRVRENAFLAKHGLALDRVARKTLDKLGGNPARILVGFDYRVGDFIARASPALAGRFWHYSPLGACDSESCPRSFR
jgi:hypothetical protein